MFCVLVLTFVGFLTVLFFEINVFLFWANVVYVLYSCFNVCAVFLIVLRFELMHVCSGLFWVHFFTY